MFSLTRHLLKKQLYFIYSSKTEKSPHRQQAHLVICYKLASTKKWAHSVKIYFQSKANEFLRISEM